MAKTSTKEDFIKKSASVWSDRWDYSLVEYMNRITKVTILCKDHGPFKQSPQHHLAGQVACSGCRNDYISTEEFIERSTKFWGDRWDYSKSQYVNAGIKVTITCKDHGDFEQLPSNHYRGNVGCPNCARNIAAKTTEQFVNEAKELWGNRWDYSLVDYKSASTPVEIVCNEHGSFRTTPTRHLKKVVGCNRCVVESRELNMLNRIKDEWGDRWDTSEVRYVPGVREVNIICKEHGMFPQDFHTLVKGVVGCPGCNGGTNLRKTQERFLEEAKEVWEDRWDYYMTLYERGNSKVIIGCREHGEFEQTANKHLQGQVGCNKCSGRFPTTEDFISKAVELWNERWSYDSVEYSGAFSPVEITCKEHGSFLQTPDGHMAGKVGCRSCVSLETSESEKDFLNFLLSLDIEVEENRRGLLPNKSLEIDAYIPSREVGFEFNGLYWHSEKFKDKNYHYTKWKMCKEEGISLYQVWEDAWRDRPEFVKSHVKRILGKSDEERINARDISVRTITHGESDVFLNRHHIQGSSSASVYVGGFHNGKLVAVALFHKRNKGRYYELVRYATSAIVRGGHSKLVSWFERNYEYDHLVTFADLTFGNGELYRRTGWQEDKTLQPDYSYVRKGSRHHKFGFRLKRFREDPSLKYEEGLSESQLANHNNLYRVYDAGKIRFVKPHPDTI